MHYLHLLCIKIYEVYEYKLLVFSYSDDSDICIHKCIYIVMNLFIVIMI